MTEHIYSYMIKGLLHCYWWILSNIGISLDPHKLTSFDIPTQDNNQCNNGLKRFFNISAAAWQNQQNDMCQAKTQISLGNCPVWSESSLCAQWVAKTQCFFMGTVTTLIRLGGLRLAHRSFCWFCRAAAHLSIEYTMHLGIKALKLDNGHKTDVKEANFLRMLIVHFGFILSVDGFTKLWRDCG